jgi:hypothetical protein
MALGGTRPPYPELRHGHVSEAAKILALLTQQNKNQKKAFVLHLYSSPHSGDGSGEENQEASRKPKLLFGSPLTQICA